MYVNPLLRNAACASALAVVASTFVTRPLDAQGPPPAFMIPCGAPQGAPGGGGQRGGPPPGALPPGGPPPGGFPAGGFPAGGFPPGGPPPGQPGGPPPFGGPPQSVGMPPTLPSVSVMLPTGLRITPVQGSVYMISGAGGNITVQVGSDGTLLVDSGRADRADVVIAAVRQMTAAPIRLIINTGADAEHTGGNDAVGRAGRKFTTGFGRGAGSGDAPGAAIMARQAVQNRLIAEKATECALPTTTYDVFPTRSIFLNGEGISLHHMPAASSDGDSFVFFRRSDVVSAGDIFNTNLYPIIDLAHGGSIDGTIAALNALLELTIPALKQEGGTMVIPGHGRLADEADVSEYRDMVTIVRDRVRSLVAKRMTLEQVKAQQPTLDFDGRYGATDGPSTTDKFIEAVYRGVSPRAAATPAAPTPQSTGRPRR